jgi:DNA repair protein RadC
MAILTAICDPIVPANIEAALTQVQDEIIASALEILKQRMRPTGRRIADAKDVQAYLSLKLVDLEREVFGMLLMNIRGDMVHDEVLFLGSLDHTSVYPREVLKLALVHNAASVILYHNHPSGDSAPSFSDHTVTKVLAKALDVAGIRLHDHIITACGADAYSFAENHVMPKLPKTGDYL